MSVDDKERASLLRARAAIDALLEKGYGDGRGGEADDAATEFAMRFGELPIERARSLRLREALERVCMGCDGHSRGEAIALGRAREELDHDTKYFMKDDR